MWKVWQDLDKSILYTIFLHNRITLIRTFLIQSLLQGMVIYCITISYWNLEDYQISYISLCLYVLAKIQWAADTQTVWNLITYFQDIFRGKSGHFHESNLWLHNCFGVEKTRSWGTWEEEIHAFIQSFELQLLGVRLVKI